MRAGVVRRWSAARAAPRLIGGPAHGCRPEGVRLPMPSSRLHLFAASVLIVGGGALAVTALAIVVARVVIGTGLPGVVATPADTALLDDLIAVLPFIATFAGINVAAGVALATGQTWGTRVARWVTGVAAATGLLGLMLLIAA